MSWGECQGGYWGRDWDAGGSMLKVELEWLLDEWLRRLLGGSRDMSGRHLEGCGRDVY